MTVPHWGRVTPVQGFMLMLAGHVLHRLHESGMVEPDQERLDAMRQGRKALCQLTGQDFGFDLARWHEYLLSDNRHGYKHPYAGRVVKRAIEEALHDQDRLRLVNQLEE